MDGGISGKNNTFGRFNGGNVAAAWAMDSVFANMVGPTGSAVGALGGSGQQLTRYFSITGAFEHYWTPALRTDFWASYTAADYNDVATTIFCSSPVGPVRTVGMRRRTSRPVRSSAVTRIGISGRSASRTIWNPAPQFDIGFEVFYTQLETKHDPGTTRLTFGGSGGRAAGLYVPSTRTSGDRSCACSVTSGHDRCDLAGSPKNPGRKAGGFSLGMAAWG